MLLRPSYSIAIFFSLSHPAGLQTVSHTATGIVHNTAVLVAVLTGLDLHSQPLLCYQTSNMILVNATLLLVPSVL